MSSHPDGQGLLSGNSGLPLVRRFSDEWAILQFLKKWKPSDIRKAIDENVDLADLILDNWVKTRTIRWIARRNKKLDDNGYLSPENVLYWFSVRRPDLYEEITEGDGPDYIKRNFDKVRDILFNQ